MQTLIKLKKVIKTKIKFVTAEKFIGILILFSITLQIFAPLRAIATHSGVNGWHTEGKTEGDFSTGNLPKLSQEDFDLLYKAVLDGSFRKGLTINEALAYYGTLSVSDLQTQINNLKNNNKLDTSKQQATGETIDDSCSGTLAGWTIRCLVTRGIGWVGYIVLQAVSYLLFISAKIFDLSAQLSLDYRAYSAKTAVPVYLGWRAARDFVNILFIFIILIIALALILQVQQYYSRQVLVKLVGVALFINFSFFLCQQIINFTNSAAIYFKDRVTGCAEGTCDNSWELSKIFVKELNPQTMLNNYTVEVPPLPDSDTTGTKEQYAEFNKMQEKNPGIIAMIIATFGGIIIMFTASFVLLAAAGMFLLRLVMLWNLIILAPIAITASILPITQSHFRAWWTRFTREAFFAPSMMFMFYIEMSILKQGFLRDFVKGNAPSGANVFGSLGTTFTFNFYLIAIYILMMMLFVKALFVAKSMSASGANAVWNGGKRLAKWGTGQYGKKPLYATGRFARSRVAPTAERIAKGEGEGRLERIAQGTFGKLTGLRAASRKIAKDERVATEAKTKKWEGLTNDEKAKELGLMKTSKYTDKLREGDMSGASIAKVVALVQSLQKTGGLGKVNEETLKDTHSYLKSRGMDTKELETFMPSLAKDNKGREKAVQRQQADKVYDYLQITDQFDYTKNPENRDLHLKTWGKEHLKETFKAVETGDEKATSSAKGLLNGYISKYGDSMDKIVEGLEKDNNNSAASFLKTAEGERMFQTIVKKTEIETPRVTQAKEQEIEINRPLAPGTYASKAQAKEDLQLENRELVNNVILNKNGKLDKTDEGKERTFEIMRQANDKQLSDILATLQTLADTEKKELLTMTAKKDNEKGTDEAKRIVNIDPTLIRSADQVTKNYLGIQTVQEAVNKMPSRDARYLSHNALMDEEIIKALSKQQLMDIAENKNPTKEEINKIIITLKTPLITIPGAPQTAVSDEIKKYIENSSYWGNAYGNRPNTP